MIEFAYAGSISLAESRRYIDGLFSPCRTGDAILICMNGIAALLTTRAS